MHARLSINVPIAGSFCGRGRVIAAYFVHTVLSPVRQFRPTNGPKMAGFSYHGGSWHNFSTSHPNATGGFAGFMAALLAALWAYDGWNLVTTVSGEIRDPQRSLPIALMFGVGTVAVLYIAVNAALQFVMPARRHRWLATAGIHRRGSGPWALGCWDRVGWYGAFYAGVPQRQHDDRRSHTLRHVTRPLLLRCARARRSPLPHALNCYRGAGRSRRRAHVVCPELSAAVSLTLFAEYLFYMAATVSGSIFRVKEPNALRPYRTWGYPVVPVLFIAASAMLLYYSFRADVKYSLVEIGMIAAGVPFYLFFAAKRSAGANCLPVHNETLR